jgi:hypothetical protein
MTDPTTGASASESEPLLVDPKNISDWTDIGREMWTYLTGRGAAVNYTFENMIVEVPRDIGPDAPRATWRFDGTLRVTTSDDEAAGSDPHRA